MFCIEFRFRNSHRIGLFDVARNDPYKMAVIPTKDRALFPLFPSPLQRRFIPALMSNASVPHIDAANFLAVLLS